MGATLSVCAMLVITIMLFVSRHSHLDALPACHCAVESHDLNSTYHAKQISYEFVGRIVAYERPVPVNTTAVMAEFLSVISVPIHNMHTYMHFCNCDNEYLTTDFEIKIAIGVDKNVHFMNETAEMASVFIQKMLEREEQCAHASVKTISYIS